MQMLCDSSEYRSVLEEDFVFALRAAGLSGLDYISHYPDLLSVLPFDDVEGICHFVEFGLMEKRLTPLNLQWDGYGALSRYPSLSSVQAAILLEALATSHIRQFSGDLKLWRYAQNRCVREFKQAGGSPFLVFGDSHAILYAVRHPLKAARWLLPIDLRCVGASARGLGRTPSISGNGEAIRRFFAVWSEPLSTCAAIIFKFGQVDLEFIYYYNLLKQTPGAHFDSDDFAKFSIETADRYMSFMEQLFPPKDRCHITIASVFPPTLGDEHWASGYIKAFIGISEDAALSAEIRGFKAPSIALRTEMHRQYNQQLGKRACDAGFRFLNDFDAFLGRDGLIDSAFTGIQNGRDHHIDECPASYERISEVLWGHIDNRAAPSV